MGIISRLFPPRVTKLLKARDLEGLKKAADHENASIRAQALSALGQLGSDSPIPVLTAALDEKSADCRLAAALALQGLGKAEGKEHLTRLADDSRHPADVRIAAALILEQKDIEASMLVERASQSELSAIVQKLYRIGHPFCAGALLKILRFSTHSSVVSGAVNALKAILRERVLEVPGRKRVERALSAYEKIQKLSYRRPEIREGKPEIAFHTRDKFEFYDLIGYFLYNEDEKIRADAARGLGWLKVKQAGGTQAAQTEHLDLLTKGRKDPSYQVRYAILGALVDLLGEQALGYLEEGMKDEHYQVRGQSASLSGRLRLSESVNMLIPALQDSEELVRNSAATALGKIGDNRATDALIAALQDSEKWVRANAAGALGEMKDSRAIDALIATLNDPEVVVHANASDALSNFKEERVIQSLLQHVDDCSPNQKVIAWQSLEKLGYPDAAEKLQEAKGYLNELTRAATDKERVRAEAALNKSAKQVSRGPDPVCPSCGTVYNRSVVVQLLKEQSPEMFGFATWTTKFRCKKCPGLVMISGRRDE